MGEGQGRKAADVGVRREPVRHQEGMGDAFSPGRRQGIEATAELLHPSGAHPTRELAPDVGEIARAGQEQARLEHRLLDDDGDQILKFHRGNLPEMASCHDIQALVHPLRSEDRDAPSLPGGVADRRHPAPAGPGFPAPDRGLLASVRIPVEPITHSGLKPITESERWMGAGLRDGDNETAGHGSAPRNRDDGSPYRIGFGFGVNPHLLAHEHGSRVTLMPCPDKGGHLWGGRSTSARAPCGEHLCVRRRHPAPRPLAHPPPGQRILRHPVPERRDADPGEHVPPRDLSAGSARPQPDPAVQQRPSRRVRALRLPRLPPRARRALRTGLRRGSDRDRGGTARAELAGVAAAFPFPVLGRAPPQARQPGGRHLSPPSDAAMPGRTAAR